jgi:hypothetical protein
LILLIDSVDARTLDQFYDDILQAREAMLKINANISLSLQSLFLPLKSKCETMRS